MTTKTREELLSELNVIRTARGQKAIKTWKESLAKLVEKVALAGVRVSKGEPAVAEGAYINEREAQHRTGVKKPRTKINGHKAAPAPKGKTTDRGEIHLSDIAASINMTARLARIKARANKTDIRKLEVKGKKYVFPTSSKAQVLAILQPKE